MIVSLRYSQRIVKSEKNKHFSLFHPSDNDRFKKFHNIGTNVNIVIFQHQNKLERLSEASFSVSLKQFQWQTLQLICTLTAKVKKVIYNWLLFFLIAKH